MLLDNFYIQAAHTWTFRSRAADIARAGRANTESVDNECYQLLEGNSETKNDWTFNLQERSTRFRSCPLLLGSFGYGAKTK